MYFIVSIIIIMLSIGYAGFDYKRFIKYDVVSKKYEIDPGAVSKYIIFTFLTSLAWGVILPAAIIFMAGKKLRNFLKEK